MPLNGKGRSLKCVYNKHNFVNSTYHSPYPYREGEEKTHIQMTPKIQSSLFLSLENIVDFCILHFIYLYFQSILP